MTKTAKTSMAMYDFDLLSDYDVPENGEERKDGREGGLSVDDQKWNMVDLQAIGEVADSSTASVGMRYYNDFVASVDEFLRNGLD